MGDRTGRRILFVTWDGGGNVHPLLALGPRLAARGWDVHAYGPPSLVDRFAAAGIAYATRDVADPWDVTAMATDVRDEIVRTGAGVALVDYMLPGALCGAEATGRPTAALVHTLYWALLDGGAPGPIAMAASVDGVNAARRTHGLDDVTSLGALLDRCARVLVTCPADLDLPRPLLQPRPAPKQVAPWSALRPGAVLRRPIPRHPLRHRPVQRPATPWRPFRQAVPCRPTPREPPLLRRQVPGSVVPWRALLRRRSLRWVVWMVRRRSIRWQPPLRRRAVRTGAPGWPATCGTSAGCSSRPGPMPGGRRRGCPGPAAGRGWW